MSEQPNSEILVEEIQQTSAKIERKTNSKRLDLAMIMTMSVGLMSLCALGVSLYQAHLMNEQSSIMFFQGKAASLPILEFDNWRSFDDDGITTYKIVVTNKGTGPLIIKNILFKFNGEPVLNWTDLFSKVPDSDKLDLWMTNETLSGSVLSAGEELVFIDSKNNRDLAELLFEAADNIKMKVCYVSVYDDWFQSTIKGLENRVTNDNENIPYCRVEDSESFMD